MDGIRLLRNGRMFAAGLLAAALLSVTALPAAESGSKDGSQPLPRIIGGRPSAEGAYPVLVGVLRAGVADPFQAQFCAGTVIASRVVLTAAHCYANDDGSPDLSAEEIRVLSGVTDLRDPRGVLHEVEAITIHEDYRATPFEFVNDIALLHLREPLEIPALPQNQSADNPLAQAGATARIMGWGARVWNDTIGRGEDFPTNLHEADLPLLSNAECAVALAGVGLTDVHVCAGFVQQGGVDTCQADSGGPLVVGDGDGGFLQVGITSFGIGCGLPMRPGVYTRVSSFADWIAANMSPGLVVPHWGNGQGLVTDLIVFNPSENNPLDAQISFRDGAGEEIPSALLLDEATLQQQPQGPVFDGRNLQLPPQGIRTISTTGAGDLLSGSIRIDSPGAVAAAIRFRIEGIGIAGVGTAEPFAAVMLPARREGRLSTGVAVHNPGVQPITVDLTLKDEAGVVVAGGNAVLELPAGGQVARFMQQLFPDAQTEGFSGSICLRAQSGTLAAVALELGDQPGEFTTLPVSPIR